MDVVGSGRWRTLQIAVPGGAAPLEHVLLVIVRPWTARALAAGWLSAWFLIRPPAFEPAPARLLLQFRDTDRRRLSDLSVRVETFLADQSHPTPTGDLVVQRAYQPPVERFGGEQGVAVAVAHHIAATRVALNAIERAPAPEDRLAATAWLLTVSALARGADRSGAVAWLRHYAGAGSDAPRVADLLPHWGIPDHGPGNGVWRRLLDGVPLAVAAADGDLDTWFRLHHHTWAALSELRATGDLSVPPDVVFDALVRLTHNRIGLSTRACARTALLMAIALATGRADRRHGLAS
jgi:hypothetical protein